VVELLLPKSQAMSEFIEISNEVSYYLDRYPSEDQFFRSTRKVVLILGDTFGVISKLFTRKKKYMDKQFNSRFWVPNILEAENATLVFHDYDIDDEPELQIARIIYLRKIIFKRPILAKVLFAERDIINFKHFKDKCENCFAYFYCHSNDTRRQCWVERFTDGTPKVKRHFFKFLAENIEFKEIDLRFYDWEINPTPEQQVSKIYNEFEDDVLDFAHSFCNYLAPEQAYKDTSIPVQNEALKRLQITNELHYNRYDLLPSNFEEVFQRMNISNQTIKNKWTDIKEKQQHWNKSWKYLTIDYQRFDLYFNAAVSAIDAQDSDIFGDKKREKEWEMLMNVKDQIREYQAEYIVSQFKNIINRKIEDVVDEIFSKMLNAHAAKFFKPLQKLNTWLELNVLSLEQHDTITRIFAHLEYQLDKYFEVIRTLIEIWFSNKRVPHDWEARLIGFGMDDLDLVTGYYNGDLKTYLSKVTEFSEFINIVDYTVRDCLYLSLPELMFSRHTDRYTEINDFYNLRKDSMGNLSQFFKEWKIIWPNFKPCRACPYKRYSPEMNKIKNESLTVLENVYQSKFINATFDHELPNLWRGVSQQLLFVRDFKANDYYGNFPENIIKKLEAKKLSLLKHFVNLRVQSLIRHESTKVQSVVTHIYGLFIQHFKTELDDWQTSQPYKRLDFLKYNYFEFADFFREIEMAFNITNLDFPEDDYNYFKSVQMQFDILQKAVKRFLIEEKMSTKGDWGHGMRVGQEIYTSSAASLSSPILFGLETLKSATEIPFASMSKVNSLLLLASVLLLKVKKLKWKF
jgi:hypothetical protein